ncbi:MAG TPA: DUF3363 domain-containing protein, partial [Burkholderiales bacterium]|nr:DUF3363 domain-containing protein [Burkholderiales bacterium]
VGVGMVDEITDRTWVVIDAVDGRAHYAELGHLKPEDVPSRGMIVALAGDSLQGRPTPHPKVQLLTPLDVELQVTYEGPTWLDQAIVSKWRPEAGTLGYAAELDKALAARGRWLANRDLATASPTGEISPKSEMMRTLRQAETDRIVREVSRSLNATHVQAEPGVQISGIYDRVIRTPTGNIAVIRREDTFTLAPWRPALEPMRGRAVVGVIGPSKVTWTLNRGRGLPGRA